jgi:limonene-1,2-epoxide hydrolase
VSNKLMIHSRRSFLMAGGGVAAASTIAMPSIASAAEQSEAEKANEAVVRALCEDIATLDIEKTAGYLADEFRFQLFEGQPIIEGKEAFLKFIAGFTAQFKSCKFEVHRLHTIGNLVLTDRTDTFYPKAEGDPTVFKVSGFHWVKDGKFYEWKDYTLPNE